MLRVVGTSIRAIAARAIAGNLTKNVVSKYSPIVGQIQCRNFSALSGQIRKYSNPIFPQHKTLLSNLQAETLLAPLPQLTQTPVRTVTKFSRGKGIRKSVKSVIRRFYRLNWGIWIRTKAGVSSKMWRKRAKRKTRLRRHVFVNATQSKLLDKMVTSYWRRPHYYVDDPYNPYHKREEFLITRKAPL